MTGEVREKLIEEINQLFQNYSFSNYFNEYDLDYIYEEIDCNSSKYYDYESGASKFVIIPEEGDYVFKIPFICDYDGNELCGVYNVYNHFDEDYEPNEGWDYCEVEEYVYKKAEKHKLGKYFAKTEFLCCIGSHPIYVQEKCECGVPDHNSSKDRKNISKKLSKKEKGDFHLWETEFYLKYGKKELKRILDFIDEYKIADLHHQNIGVRYNSDRPVFLDYSDYFS